MNAAQFERDLDAHFDRIYAEQHDEHEALDVEVDEYTYDHD